MGGVSGTQRWPTVRSSAPHWQCAPCWHAGLDPVTNCHYKKMPARPVAHADLARRSTQMLPPRASKHQTSEGIV